MRDWLLNGGSVSDVKEYVGSVTDRDRPARKDAMKKTMGSWCGVVVLVGMASMSTFGATNAAQNASDGMIVGVWHVVPTSQPGSMGQSGPDQSILVTASNYVYRFKEQPGFQGILDQTGTEYFPWITDQDGVRYCVIEQTYVIKAAASPRQIDLTRTGKDGSVQVSKGIYKLEGDDLWICYGSPGEDRPGEFKKDDYDFKKSLIHATKLKK